MEVDADAVEAVMETVHTAWEKENDNSVKYDENKHQKFYFMTWKYTNSAMSVQEKFFWGTIQTVKDKEIQSV